MGVVAEGLPLTVSPEQWARISQLFDAARQLPPEARESLLQSRASDDAEVLRRTRMLLSNDADDNFLSPRVRLAPDDPAFASRLIGATVGAYRIEREIGRGGMGVVYEGRYVDPQFERRVAIKTLPIGIDHPEMRWRFRRERQILSRLQHPNIASLFDGGTTDDGVPYIVMEYVDGVRIDTWCTRQRLTVPQRLDLFRQVCAAVQFAHASLVVHRDLKPGNILVATDGTVKLLDFGVAKLLSTESSEFEATEYGVAPRTTAFASPEQLRGEAVTISSDVYSLGVLLYRLLAGSAPFDTDGRSAHDVQQLLATQTPRVPSDGVTDDHARACGASDAGPLRASLKGDLDAIALMALRHDPARRYASVDALSADVLRYLKGQPVLARPERLSHVLWSLARRNRALTGAALVSLLALVTATAVSLQSARIARDEARRATRMMRMLENIAGASDPFSPDGLRLQGGNISLQQALDASRSRIAIVLADDPRARADLYRTLGDSYRNLDQLDLAAAMLDSATRLHTETLGATSAQVRFDRLSAATNDLARGDVDRGASALESLRSSYATARVPGDSGLVDVLTLLANVRLTSFLRSDGVVPMLQEALALERAGAHPRNRTLSLAEATMAIAYAEMGDVAASDSLLASATARLLPDSLRSPAELVYVFAFAGFSKYLRENAAEAEMIWRRAHRFAIRVFGPQHPITAETHSGLSFSLLGRGQNEEGRARADSAVAIQRGRPTQDAGILCGLYRLQMSYALAQHDIAGARAWREEAERELGRTGGRRPTLEVQLLWLTAALDMAQSQPDSAAIHLNRASRIATTEIGATHPLAVLASRRAAEFAARQSSSRR